MKINQNKLKELIEKRETQASMAKVFNCTRSAVCKAVKKYEFEKTQGMVSDMIENYGSETPLKTRKALLADTEEVILSYLDSLCEYNTLIYDLFAKKQTVRTQTKIISIIKKKGNIIGKIINQKTLFESIRDLNYMTRLIMTTAELQSSKGLREFRGLVTLANKIEMTKKSPLERMMMETQKKDK